jgi:chaperone required for assembly of F1-ATPase
VVNVGGIRPDGRSPRWYKDVRVEKANGGYTFLLDGRAARTQHDPLVVPSELLATAMAFEWMAQDKFIQPDALPITRLATMAIDQMPNARQRVLNHLMTAFDTDLTCVRIEEDLLASQRKTFGPMLDWFAEKFGAKPKVSILYGKLKHPPELVRSVREYLSELDDFHLQAMEILSAATRSVILPLYLVHGCIGIEQAIKAARLEEDWQIRQCGNIASSHDVDRTEVSTRISVGSLFWRLLELK